MKKQMIKSVIAVVSAAALSLGIFPGNIAEDLGVVTESKAAEAYPIINFSGCQTEDDVKKIINDNGIPVYNEAAAQEAFKKAAATGTLEKGGEDSDGTVGGTVYIIGYEKTTATGTVTYYFHTARVDILYNMVIFGGLYGASIQIDSTTSAINIAGSHYNDKLTYKALNFKTVGQTTSATAFSPEFTSDHQHAYEWQILTDPTIDEDGVYAYICSCGDIKEKQPISAAQVFVKDLYGKVKEAPQNGTVTYDAKSWSTISDYLLKKMAERNDVTVTIRFQYQKADYEITFPAGTDYTAVLNDTETMYGFFGIANILGLEVKAL